MRILCIQNSRRTRIRKYALSLLHRCSHLVQSLTRRHGCRCFALGELDPTNNYSNRKVFTAVSLISCTDHELFKILVMLRYEDRKSFLHPEWIMNVLLHELTHVQYGRHGPRFHIPHWRLRSEHQKLLTKMSLQRNKGGEAGVVENQQERSSS